jgi:Fe-S-cluster containining protein
MLGMRREGIRDRIARIFPHIIEIEVRMEHVNKRIIELISTIENDISSGLLYTHTRISDNTKKVLESSSFFYALIELLSEKGLITIEELDGRKKQVAERLVRRFTESGLGLLYHEPESDKYAFAQEAVVDCQGRLSICKSICCKLPFALSRQDVEEGIIRWEFGRPYLIKHGHDGYCCHLNMETYRCEVHEQRPVPCRGFNCRDDEKWHVWLDYDLAVFNQDLAGAIDKDNRNLYFRFAMENGERKG